MKRKTIAVNMKGNKLAKASGILNKGKLAKTSVSASRNVNKSVGASAFASTGGSESTKVFVFLGLGSNLGDRKFFLKRAVEKISGFSKILKKSSIYETEPISYKEQGDFLNMAVEIQTDLDPKKLLSRLLQVEMDIGRIRDDKCVKNGPIVIDIDLLFYGDLVIDEPLPNHGLGLKSKLDLGTESDPKAGLSLRVPHPRLHERNFVLTPLCEIAPDKIHPVLKKNIKTLLDNLGSRDRVSKIGKGARK